MQSRTLWPPIMWLAIVCVFVSTSGVAAAQTSGIFGVVGVVVADPQRRPVPQADITLRAQLSSWQEQAQSDADGKFSFTAVPAGEYTISGTKPGFQTAEQRIIVRSGTVTSVMLDLPLGAVSETVHVTGREGTVNLKSVTTESLVTRDQIERAPGAARSNSLDVVTQFVPGSYMIHDQLHIRGGHQVSWLVDGVPVPNTNILRLIVTAARPDDAQRLAQAIAEFFVSDAISSQGSPSGAQSRLHARPRHPHSRSCRQHSTRH